MSAIALFAHVPVDMFDIVGGPGPVECFDLRDALAIAQDLYRDTPGMCYVDFRVRLRTHASNRTFMRTLRLAEIFAVNGNEFQFTATFSGCVVSGIYNMKTRSGWFNLD